MSVVSVKEILVHASGEDYFIPAFNVYNLEALTAVLEAAQESLSPVIIQLSAGGRKYVRSPKVFLEYMKEMAEEVSVPVAFNHDHCPDVRTAIEAVELGFSGVMFDGSSLPFEENVRQTREVVEFASRYDVNVEAELGRIPGFEDLVFSGHAEYTDPELARKFVELTGCGSLAVSVGTSHGGVEASDYLPLDLAQLKAIHACLPDYPLVLHGAASLPPHLIDEVNNQGGQVAYLKNCSEESVSQCASFGVCKANMDVDNFLCFTREVRKQLNEHPDKYDPRTYLEKGRCGFKEEVLHKIRTVAHSDGKAWLTKEPK